MSIKAFRTRAASSAARFGINRQQLLEKAADFSDSIDKVNLQDPVSRPALGIGLAKRLIVAVANREPRGVRRFTFVRKMPDQVPGRNCTEFPAGWNGESGDKVVQLTGREIRRAAIEVLALLECGGDVPDQLSLPGIRPERISAAEIRLPFI